MTGVQTCALPILSGVRIEASESVFAICTVDENQFVTYSCKKCFNEIKELKHEIISKKEFEKYLS